VPVLGPAEATKITRRIDGIYDIDRFTDAKAMLDD
jgi:hypothetical protein